MDLDCGSVLVDAVEYGWGEIWIESQSATTYAHTYIHTQTKNMELINREPQKRYSLPCFLLCSYDKEFSPQSPSLNCFFLFPQYTDDTHETCGSCGVDWDRNMQLYFYSTSISISISALIPKEHKRSTDEISSPLLKTLLNDPIVHPWENPGPENSKSSVFGNAYLTNKTLFILLALCKLTVRRKHGWWWLVSNYAYVCMYNTKHEFE